MTTATLAITANATAAETTENLARAAKNGDCIAFGKLHDRFKDVVLGIACNVCKGKSDLRIDPQEAKKDIAQIVWISAWNNIGKLNEPADFQKWLRTIAINKATNYYRKDKLRANKAPEVQHEITRSLGYDRLELPHFDRSSFVENKGVNLAQFKAAMAKLTPAHREVINLRYFNRLRFAKIAEKIETNLPTARSRCHYALKSLYANLNISTS